MEDDDEGFFEEEMMDEEEGHSDDAGMLTEVIQMLADRLEQRLPDSAPPSDSDSDELEPPHIDEIIEEIGQLVQEPTALSDCEGTQQLPQLLVTLLTNRHRDAVTATTIANTVGLCCLRVRCGWRLPSHCTAAALLLTVLIWCCWRVRCCWRLPSHCTAAASLHSCADVRDLVQPC